MDDETMDEALGDSCRMGMRFDALKLKDPAKKADRNATIARKDYVPDWHPDFLNPQKTTDVFIDGLILVAGTGDLNFLRESLKKITDLDSEGSLHGAITVYKLLTGKQRDKEGMEKHEQYVEELNTASSEGLMVEQLRVS
jgi:hypothetical protein